MTIRGSSRDADSEHYGYWVPLFEGDFLRLNDINKRGKLERPSTNLRESRTGEKRGGRKTLLVAWVNTTHEEGHRTRGEPWRAEADRVVWW